MDTQLITPTVIKDSVNFQVLTKMNFFSAIATAALVTSPFILPSAAKASLSLPSMYQCIDDAASAVSIAEHGRRLEWSRYKKEGQIICHYAFQAQGSAVQRIEVGIEKAGYKGKIEGIDLLTDYERHTFVQPEPKSQPQRSASKPQTEYEAMMERVNSGAPTPTPSRSTYTPAPRSTSKPSRTASSSSSRCPEGTSYHKIKSGGLLFKKTVAEGCYTDFQASQLRMQADSNHRQKTRDFQRDIQEATKTRDPINCSGTVNSWGNGYATYNTNCY